jgi:chitin synthase
MDPAVTTIFASNGGADVTSLIDGLNLNPAQLQAQRTCLRNLFLVGRVDTRNSPQCQFSRYILLAMSILIVCIIGFKCATISLGSASLSRAQVPRRTQLCPIAAGRGLRVRGSLV